VAGRMHARPESDVPAERRARLAAAQDPKPSDWCWGRVSSSPHGGGDVHLGAFVLLGALLPLHLTVVSPVGATLGEVVGLLSGRRLGAKLIRLHQAVATSVR
jgi:hypothetical protein